MQPNDLVWFLGTLEMKENGLRVAFVPFFFFLPPPPAHSSEMEHRYTLRVDNGRTDVSRSSLSLASVSKASAEEGWDYSATEMANVCSWLPSVSVRFAVNSTSFTYD